MRFHVVRSLLPTGDCEVCLFAVSAIWTPRGRRPSCASAVSLELLLCFERAAGHGIWVVGSGSLLSAIGGIILDIERGQDERGVVSIALFKTSVMFTTLQVRRGKISTRA